MSRTLLVTGGAGFIGSSFARHMIAETSDRVIVLDKLTYAGDRRTLEEVSGPRLTFVHGDISDASLVNTLVSKSDVVVHFAAESHNDNSLDDPAPFVQTNIVGTFTILEAVRAHGVRLHHVSTDEVYGDLPVVGTERFSEHSPYRPSSPYSASKAGSDMLVRAWIRSFGIRATISNCSNNYGPFQHVEKFIPRQITQLLQGARPQLYGNGENVRDWIHVDDHSSAVRTILDRGELGRTYLIGVDGERSNRQVVEALLRAFGQPEDAFDLVPDRPGHDRRYAIDATPLREELNWRPLHTDFAKGLIDTIEWYRTHRAWWEGAKAETESRYSARGR